eukprot:TRINITY_DN3593_c0_g1_i2.p1 TRINITY_DN3593_c0_g1~~TRINITY_DN3593_c0_g1_i2.p1  ORF type:complete len:739 (+),score=249.72 TRINITY_DN3593_c0_g1_i2:48-2264(+)
MLRPRFWPVPCLLALSASLNLKTGSVNEDAATPQDTEDPKSALYDDMPEPQSMSLAAESMRVNTGGAVMLEQELRRTRSKLAETERELSREQDREEVTQILLHTKTERLKQDQQKLKLLRQLHKQIQMAAQKRSKVLAETHNLLEDPLFADASYSPGFSAEEPLRTLSFTKKQQKESLAKQMKAVGAAKEEAKLEQAETDRLQANLQEKKRNIQQLKHHAEQSAHEVANLRHQHDHLEAELMRMEAMRHSDETKTALKDLEDKKQKLQKTRDELKRLKLQVEKAQNMTKQNQAELTTEKAKSVELVAQEKSEVAEMRTLQKRVKDAQEERQMLVEEQQLLKELEKTTQEQAKLKQVLAEQTVKLQTMKNRLKEEQSRSKEMVEDAKKWARKRMQHAEDEAEDAEAELRKARKRTEEQYREHQKDADKKFKAQQAKLDEEFEQRLKLEEKRLDATKLYKLESLRSEVKAAEDELSAVRKRFKEDSEDAEQKLAETRGELERENKAAASRVEEQSFKARRVQNRYIKQERQAEAKLTASESQLRKVKEQTHEAEQRLHQLQADLAKPIQHRKSLELQARSEAEAAMVRLQAKESETKIFESEAVMRLEDQKAEHAAQLKKLEQAFNETRDSMSEQVKFYERKLSDVQELHKQQRNDALRKEGILRVALAKDQKQLLEARSYLRNELKAAKLASEKVKALKSHLEGSSGVEKQEAKVEDAVDRWRNSLESMKLDEEQQGQK